MLSIFLFELMVLVFHGKVAQFLVGLCYQKVAISFYEPFYLRILNSLVSYDTLYHASNRFQALVS